MTADPHPARDDHPGLSDPDTPERSATVTPLRPRRRRRSDSITVEQVETTPMTPQEYQRAVTALATLVNEWQYRRDNLEQSGQKAA